MKKPIIAIAISLLAASASAQPKQNPDELRREGEKQYNLGNFEKAIESFKAAYAIEDKPGHLYNIAQAYRQLGDCRNAVFFYKRFLSLKANDTAKPLKPELKAEIEGRIIELDACAKEQEAIKTRPPDPLAGGNDDGGDDGGGGGDGGGGTTGGGTTVAGGGGDDDDPDDDDPDEDDPDAGVTVTVHKDPTMLAVRAVAGAGIVGAGGLDVPIQISAALTGGYPLKVAPKVMLEIGAGFTFTPVPYDVGGTTETASLISVLGNVGTTFAVTPKIGIHGDAGVGIMVFNGLKMGNPFTAGGAETTGGLTMFNIRLAAVVEYAVTQNLLVTATPIAFAYSPPKDGLSEDISALTRIDFMLGLGYRR